MKPRAPSEFALAEEIQLGTSPNTPDAPPVYPSIDAGDYVPLTMRVGAAGKMVSANCSVCHQVTLRAGNFIRTSPKTSGEEPTTTAESVIQFLRGTNYPVQVTCNPYYQSLLTSNQANATVSPLYTATYTAQFLFGTNGGNYPFIVDANKLMGEDLPMVQEVLPKRATLYIPDMTIAADNDRNGVVDFRDWDDRTSATNPFVFWVNDDADSGSDDAAGDINPTNNPVNSANSVVDGLRDLEDFARLQFKIDGLPGQFMSGGYQVKVYLTNLAGSPSLRLFSATETNGGIGYLTNTTTATAQFFSAPLLGVLTNGTPLTLGSSVWLAVGSNNFFRPMIFEGISTGRCVITFGFSTNNQPPVAVSRPFYLDLKRVTQLYEHWTLGDNTTDDWTQITTRRATRTADSAVFGKARKAEDLDYIVFVHGWRMQPWERRAFASTAYKRLWHQNYRGRFGLYSWPTDYTGVTFWDMLNPITGSINRQNYDRSEQRAWNSALGLRDLLEDLNQSKSPYRVRLIAHSMGNIVASEALRFAGRKASKPPLVQGYIASQAASVAHAYDAVNPEIVRSGIAATLTPYDIFIPDVYSKYPRTGVTNVYLAGMKNAVQGTNIFNFNNLVDYALSADNTWPVNQTLKPDNGWWYQLPMGWQNQSSFDMLDLENPYHAYEIFAHIAIARSKALGAAEDATHHIRGQIGGSVNLNISPFNFKANDYEHSAEFNSINMNRRTYWRQVLASFSLTNNLPNP